MGVEKGKWVKGGVMLVSVFCWALVVVCTSQCTTKVNIYIEPHNQIIAGLKIQTERNAPFKQLMNKQPQTYDSVSYRKES